MHLTVLVIETRVHVVGITRTRTYEIRVIFGINTYMCRCVSVWTLYAYIQIATKTALHVYCTYVQHNLQ